MNGINANYSHFGAQTYGNVGDPNAAGNVGRAADNASISDETLLRFQEAYGKVANELGLPDIEDANLTPAEEQQRCLDSLRDKLSATMTGFRGQKVMFDIYALLSLVQEMSQKLRNAMREVRQLENQTIQMNIKQQAEVQRRAAVCGAIAGAVVCLVQVGATAVVSGLTMKQMMSQNQMQAKTGTDVFSKAEQISNSVNDPALAQKQFDATRREVGAEAFDGTQMEHFTEAQNQRQTAIGEAQTAVDNAQQTLDTAVANRDAKAQAVTEAQRRVDAAQQRVDEAQQRVTAADQAAPDSPEAQKAYNDQKKVVDDLQTIAEGRMEGATVKDRAQALQRIPGEQSKLDALRTERITARQDLMAAKQDLEMCKQDLARAQAEANTANTAVDTAQADLATKTEALQTAQSSKTSLAKALQADVDLRAEEYQTARSKANIELEANGKISDETKAELVKAEKSLYAATAKQAREMSLMRQEGSVSIEEVAAMKTAASTRFNAAHMRGMNAADQLKGQTAITKLQMWQTISISIGQYGQQLVNSLQQLIAANATDLQAEQKMTEDQLDQIKDLFSQQLSVIQKTFEIFASIVSKESQTIEGIIRA